MKRYSQIIVMFVLAFAMLFAAVPAEAGRFYRGAAARAVGRAALARAFARNTAARAVARDIAIQNAIAQQRRAAAIRAQQRAADAALLRALGGHH